MIFRFTKDMINNIPEMATGTNRFRYIAQYLDENPNYSNEAFGKFKELFRFMVKIRASDLDCGGVGCNEKIWFRVNGEKMPYEEINKISQDEIAVMLLSVLSMDQKEMMFLNMNIDFSLSLQLDENERAQRFRGSIYYEMNSLAANFRRINARLFTLEQLNFPNPIIERFDLTNEKSGLILVTGITGSGKSSTLDTIINMNNERSHAHILVIGKPIEYIHESKKCLIRHREVGEDVLSFDQGTVQALRQDPDIIVVGEMRDKRTIATVMEVTDSGHKVFTTLHTSSAIESIHRIIGEFPPSEQDRIRNRLADILTVIVSQKLIPDRKGRLLMAKEILSVDDSVKAAIRNNNIGEIYQMITEGKNKGMFTLEQELHLLVRMNKISSKTAMGYANNKKRMSQLLTY